MVQVTEKIDVTIYLARCITETPNLSTSIIGTYALLQILQALQNVLKFAYN